MWLQHRLARISCQAEGTEFLEKFPFPVLVLRSLWSTVEAARENPRIAPTIFPKRPYKFLDTVLGEAQTATPYPSPALSRSEVIGHALYNGQSSPSHSHLCGHGYIARGSYQLPSGFPISFATCQS